MALQVALYPDPQAPGVSITNAYAWIAGLWIDFTTGSGTIEVYVHRSAAAASAVPLPPVADHFRVTLGQPVTATYMFPTLAQVQQQAATAAQANPALDPFSALRQVLYQGLLNHPKLAGATAVP